MKFTSFNQMKILKALRLLRVCRLAQNKSKQSKPDKIIKISKKERSRIIRDKLLEKCSNIHFIKAILASFANLYYSHSNFSIDKDGAWVSRQPEASIFSPNIYTEPFLIMSSRVHNNWFYAYTPKTGDIVIDLGAGIGEDTVIFSRLVGKSGKVYAVEADPIIFKYLERTVRNSKLDNVILCNNAISEKNSYVSLSRSSSHLESKIIDHMKSDSVSVECRCLDSFFADHSIKHVDFIKINIEGSELPLLRGNAKKALNITSNIAVSCHDFLFQRIPDKSLLTFDQVFKLLCLSNFTIKTRHESSIDYQRYCIYASHKQ